jgi:hypothetical protein
MQKTLALGNDHTERYNISHFSLLYSLIPESTTEILVLQRQTVFVLSKPELV